MDNEEQALAVADGRSDVRVRNDRGLMPAQEEFLAELARVFDPKAAAAGAGLNWRRVVEWLRSDLNFQRYYQELNTETAVVARETIRAGSEAASDALIKALTSEKGASLTVTCPSCESKFTVRTKVADNPSRLRAIENVLKVSGILKEVHRIEGDIGVTHLDFGQRMAMTALKRGRRISAQMFEELVNMGVINEEVLEELKRTGHPNVTIEGEAKEV